MVEKALFKTTTLVSSIGGFLKGGISKIKDYFQQEGRSSGRRTRAKSLTSRDDRRPRQEEEHESSFYETPREKSLTSRVSKSRAHKTN